MIEHSLVVGSCPTVASISRKAHSSTWTNVGVQIFSGGFFFGVHRGNCTPSTERCHPKSKNISKFAHRCAIFVPNEASPRSVAVLCAAAKDAIGRPNEELN